MKNLIIIILIYLSQNLAAQGYCSLRSPQAKINALYPECRFYKTVIATIDEESRKDINKIIPFPLHYYELGRHNLYFINGDNKTNGLVHARSEESKWGLVEIVWSLNLDLTVKDFTFQRCRSRAKSTLLHDSFKKYLIGKNFYEILNLLGKNNQSTIPIDDSAHELAQVVLESALKTIALTDLCWKKELAKIRDQKLLRAQALKQNDSSNLQLRIQKEGQKLFFSSRLRTPKDTLIWGIYENSKISSFYMPISGQFDNQKIIDIKTKINKIIRAIK
jgi:hypothetical protein